MLSLIGRRLLSYIPILFIVSIGVFMLTSLIPGDAAITIAGGPNATPEAIAAVRDKLRLDQPVLVQYWYWLSDAVRLNFGESQFSGVPVMESIWNRLPVTLSLVAAAVVVALVVGVPLGIVAGVRPGGVMDRINRLTSSLGVGVPNFWLATLLILLFAVTLKWLPPSGFVSFTVSPLGWAKSVILPAVAMGFFLAAELSRQLRAGLIAQLNANYVRTLWAKGGTRQRVIGRHALRNAASPAITVLGVQIGTLLGGTVIIEQIFSIPGLGSYLLDGITGQDLPIIQGVTMMFVLFQMTMSLIVDVSYGLLNPKVR